MDQKKRVIFAPEYKTMMREEEEPVLKRSNSIGSGLSSLSRLVKDLSTQTDSQADLISEQIAFIHQLRSELMITRDELKITKEELKHTDEILEQIING